MLYQPIKATYGFGHHAFAVMRTKDFGVAAFAHNDRSALKLWHSCALRGDKKTVQIQMNNHLQPLNRNVGM